MPIYEYECPKCGSQTEIWQKISDKPYAKCESCKARMKRLISQSTFHLKGSGWYVTDYASKRNVGEPSKEKTAGSTEKKAEKTETAAEKPKKAASSESAKKE